jgi:CubicO group peptidase (beta-lactamase class C family)
MDRWLGAALDYIPSWMDYQMNQWSQPGCLIAIVHRGKIVLEEAFGLASLASGAALTPRHRFRIASHSKSFTAAGILRLREQGRLKLDDTVGTYVPDLHPGIARATLSQVLSHSAGIVRDGSDAGQFTESRPFFSLEELLEDLRQPPVIDAGTRLKYSNHGYSLLGLVIAAAAGESYRSWIKREIVDAAGLAETLPDMPLPRGTPFARGHSSMLPLGRRVVIAGDYSTEAIGPAGGYVSTAADTARFFNQLSPGASKSVLSVASRREMVRRQWRNPHASLEGYYGLGIMSGTIGGWEWFGHSGALFGYMSRTVTVPAQGLSISVMSNAADGWPAFWIDGAVNILRTFAQNGAPSRRAAGWQGRWWSAWGPCDLVPMGDKVVVGLPGLANPFLDAAEIRLAGRDRGVVALANGYASHGEPVRRGRTGNGRIREIWVGGNRMVSKAKAVSELERRYGAKAGKRRKRARRK